MVKIDETFWEMGESETKVRQTVGLQKDQPAQMAETTKSTAAVQFQFPVSVISKWNRLLLVVKRADGDLSALRCEFHSPRLLIKFQKHLLKPDAISEDVILFSASNWVETFNCFAAIAECAVSIAFSMIVCASQSFQFEMKFPREQSE